MNHDIAHCTGIKGDPFCRDCKRRKAHEELQQMVHQGKSATGFAYQYVGPQECEDTDYGMFYGTSGHLHDQTDAMKKGGLA